MANHSETQFPMESTTFFTYFDAIVSTINESMTEKPAESTVGLLSTILASTTASGPSCQLGSIRCDPHQEKTKNCINGICCVSSSDLLCVCYPGYTGKFCIRKDTALSTGLADTPLTVVFSALIGVIVIALFVAVVALQFKYYKNRKKRFRKDEEIRKSMRVKPEIRRKEDDASTRLLRTQPGYSWRQSVRRTTCVSQKSKGLTASLSVPENLFEIGLIRERQKETNQAKSGDGGEGGGGGGERGETEGCERLLIDPGNSSSTAQLLHDKDPSMKTVHFESKSDVIHL